MKKYWVYARLANGRIEVRLKTNDQVEAMDKIEQVQKEKGIKQPASRHVWMDEK